MQWEYKTVGIEYYTSLSLKAELDGMGKDGWELVWFNDRDKAGPGPNGSFRADCIFKRPVLRVSVGGITVEGESGEIYHHRHDDPTLTVLGTLEQAMREQKRGAYKAKPGARL